MNQTGSNNVSLTFCAVIGLLVGALVTGLLMVLGDWRFLSAAAIGIIFFALAFVVLPWLFIKSDSSSVPYGAPVTGDEAGRAPSAADGADRTAAPAPTASAPNAPAPVAEPAPTVAASSGAASASSSSAGAGAAPAAAASAAASSAASATAAPAVKPSTPLPGEADVASKKGDWKYEGNTGSSDTAAAEKAAAEKAAADKAAAEKAAADKAAAEKAAADKAAAEKAAADKAASADSKDYDGDGVLEGANEGTRPQALSGPRGGKADDLKQIKGVGPAMEKLCNSLGFYHFDQIASWKPDEVAWVDANLEGFKGRVTRDTWVAQAKILAAGGETEFSKKVDKGGVY